MDYSNYFNAVNNYFLVYLQSTFDVIVEVEVLEAQPFV